MKMVCHKEVVVGEINNSSVYWAGISLLGYSIPRRCRHHGTAFMQERLHATFMANSNVIWTGYLFLGGHGEGVILLLKSNSERMISFSAYSFSKYDASPSSLLVVSESRRWST